MRLVFVSWLCFLGFMPSGFAESYKCKVIDQQGAFYRLDVNGQSGKLFHKPGGRGEVLFYRNVQFVRESDGHIGLVGNPADYMGPPLKCNAKPKLFFETTRKVRSQGKEFLKGQFITVYLPAKGCPMRPSDAEAISGEVNCLRSN